MLSLATETLALLLSNRGPTRLSPTSVYLALLSFSFSPPNTSEPSDSLHQEPLSVTPPYVNRIQYSPPASGPPSDRRVFFEYKKHCAFQEKRSNTDIF